MRTTLTKRSQTVVPAIIRERYQIKGGDYLEWIDDGRVIKVIPIPADPIKFLRAREIVHFQRFGEGMRLATDKLNSKNFYAFNPSFDKNCLK